MVAQRLSKYACLSAFTHWVVLGVLISYVQVPMPAWLKGIMIAVISCIPIVILVSETDPKSIVPIVIMSVTLCAAVGWATSRYAHQDAG